ncbi:peptidylprolyl isomerase [Chitinophaga vietnamensis]|uniref:peptidylprolyl isomerase n=1 Tax=Chitinophaga vietnamensis TaxID=2593957 RepID=UPI0011785745|nr:peptidylprolyl isomerase [Chitinophaga vietnamensis]
MSVIQKIRDKYAVVIVVVICLAIVSFLLQDAFFGKSSLARRSTAVGKVNGQELDLSEYQRRIQDEESAARQQMPNLDEQTRQYIREQVWNQFLNEQIMQDQYKKLGIVVTEAEVVDQITGKNPSPIVVQQFTHNGQFDRQQLVQVVQQASSNPQIREQLHNLQNYIAKTQEQRKYLSLVKASVYYPKWLAKQQMEDNSKTATVSYVNVPYASIADSTVKVTDSELERFIQDHKQLFKVEESRKIEYLVFDAIPTAIDSAAAIKQLLTLKAEMDTVKDIAGFINRNSDIKYYDGYVAKNEAKVPQKDSIVNLPVGSTFGPYYDNNLIVYAKMVDRKNMPDSVKVRHILVASGPQGGLPDSVAKKRADSILVAVKGGADFKALVTQLSDDPGSKETGGEYTLTPSSQFVPEFKDFALYGTKGETKVVKTQFGYHVIQIMDQTNIGPAIKVAYLGKAVDASKETNNAAYSAASEFANKNHTPAAFEKAVQEGKLAPKVADNVRPMDFVIPGIGQSRDLVRWAYDAKKGDVSNVFSLDDKYVVALLTSIRKEGTAPLDDVRPQVEAEVRKHKKAEQIIAKIGAVASLDAASKSTTQPVLKAEGVSFASPFIASLGFEPRVTGASFNKDWGTAKVSAPIEGNAGVYVIKVDSYQAAAQPAQDPATVQAAYEQSIKAMLDNQLFEVLKKKSDIKDNRGKFF